MASKVPFKGLKRKPFFIRLTSWEYWPMQVVYIPVFIYFIWLAIRARTPWFFSAANPAIDTGGMLGEKKFPLIEMLPEQNRPKTVFVPAGSALAQIESLLQDAGISFPMIAKPDIGERGFLVSKLLNQAELEKYNSVSRVDYLIQEYLDLPLEMGILHYKFPGDQKGRISSVVMKEFLTVTGDGKSTLKELIGANPRAILQWKKFEKRFGARLDEVIAQDEVMQLEAIGNHAQGTKFINGNHLINDKMVEVFDRILAHMPGINYCRYDLRTSSVEDLMQGKNIMIIEVNGVGSDPAHVYDPDYSIFSAWGDFIRMWKVIYTIAKANHKNGVPYMTTKEVREKWKSIKAYRKFAVS